MDKTTQQYDRIITQCRELFLKKAQDYGTSWRIMRLPSITDQIFIKAQRIRTLEEKGISKVGEGIAEEYIGIVNYCIIAQIQLQFTKAAGERGAHQHSQDQVELAITEVASAYDGAVQRTKTLMAAKNHDYGEAWREMRLESLTDLILMKLHRTKQIEDNDGRTLISEGVEANYQDMMNYAVFALIKLGLADVEDTNYEKR